MQMETDHRRNDNNQTEFANQRYLETNERFFPFITGDEKALQNRNRSFNPRVQPIIVQNSMDEEGVFSQQSLSREDAINTWI